MISLQKRIEEIKQATEQAASIRAAAMTGMEIVRTHGFDLWGVVANEIERMVQELVLNLPSAKATGLKAERLAMGSLTVSTVSSPLLRLEIRCVVPSGISAEIRKTFSPFEATKVAKLTPVRFCVDSEMQPWFTSGGVCLTPTEVAEALVDSVVSFFEEAVRVPQIIS